MKPFDDGLLDDEAALARADPQLRNLAESGARVRREAVAADAAVAAAVERISESGPRAVLVAGPDSRLLRAVLEPVCPVPFVAWPAFGLPGWVGTLDLVVVLAPQGDDPMAARAVYEATRRGCQLVVATPATGLVAEPATGPNTNLIPTVTGDQLAVAVTVLELLHRLSLGPVADPDVVADALDAVAAQSSPFRDLAVNPAKTLASAIADTTPMLWGGTVLSARAGRRIAESIRRATGRTALAADAEHLLPVLAATPPADVFADPFADPAPSDGAARPSLLVLDDGSVDPALLRTREELTATARDQGVRVETISAGIAVDGDVARYAAMLATGTYAAAYLRVGHGSAGSLP